MSLVTTDWLYNNFNKVKFWIAHGTYQIKIEKHLKNIPKNTL